MAIKTNVLTSYQVKQPTLEGVWEELQKARGELERYRIDVKNGNEPAMQLFDAYLELGVHVAERAYARLKP